MNDLIVAVTGVVVGIVLQELMNSWRTGKSWKGRLLENQGALKENQRATWEKLNMLRMVLEANNMKIPDKPWEYRSEEKQGE